MKLFNGVFVRAFLKKSFNATFVLAFINADVRFLVFVFCGKDLRVVQLHECSCDQREELRVAQRSAYA